MFRLVTGFYRLVGWRLEAWSLEREFQRRLRALEAQPQRTLTEVFGAELLILDLSLERLPTLSELNAAYRQRCKTAHPDRGGTATEFQQVCTAYQTLKSFLNGAAPP